MALEAHGQEPERTAEWLESELRETKARLHKVEGELEQALKQVWSMEGDVKRLAEASSSSGSTSATLAALREGMRQLDSQMGKLQDRQSAVANRTEEVLRQRQTESGRDRQELSELARQVASLTKNTEHYESRAQAIEESARRVEETVAGGRLADQSLERQMEEIATRTGRAHEAVMRVEQEVSRVAPELEKLVKVDDAQTERLQILQEQIRRLTERTDKLESISAFPEEARELLQKANFEREQLAQRLLQVERLSSDVTERLNEFLQAIARLEQRSQTQASELLALGTELNDVAEYTKSQLKRISQVTLRQRRRQYEALGQEIKELSQGEVQGGD